MHFFSHFSFLCKETELIGNSVANLCFGAGLCVVSNQRYLCKHMVFLQSFHMIHRSFTVLVKVNTFFPKGFSDAIRNGTLPSVDIYPWVLLLFLLMPVFIIMAESDWARLHRAPSRFPLSLFNQISASFRWFQCSQR